LNWDLYFPEGKSQEDSIALKIQDMINHFYDSEELIDDNQYFCSNCNKLSDADKVEKPQYVFNFNIYLYLINLVDKNCEDTSIFNLIPKSI